LGWYPVIFEGKPKTLYWVPTNEHWEHPYTDQTKMVSHFMNMKIPDLPGQKRYPLYHNGGLHPCNKIAFYTLGRFVSGEPLASVKAIKPDGSHPMPGELLTCGACEQRLFSTFELSYDLDIVRS
jgi:hypothetical protein